MTTPKNLKQRKEKRQKKQRRKEIFISINIIEPSLINEGFVVFNKINYIHPHPYPSPIKGRGVKHMFVLPFFQIKGEG